MNATPSPRPAPRHSASRVLGSAHRYLFYGWLFRDVDAGSEIERILALRHNRAQARWLPTYMRRWCVLGLLIGVAEQWAERAVPRSILPGVLELALIGTLMYLMITGICWAFLVDPRRAR